MRTFVEPLITVAKEDTTHNRRKAFSSLQNKDAVTHLFNEVGPAAVDRPGGYTRVVKLGYRFGDAAQMAVIELVDYNDVKPEGTETKKKRTRRAGKSNKPTPATKEKTSSEEVLSEDQEKKTEE